ncbi:MAG: hypothetical protein HKN49_03255 [Gammaproteobacteria bacterium]|nr:hypothetical protein [Gammaproteobacteria bacterium]
MNKFLITLALITLTGVAHGYQRDAIDDLDIDIVSDRGRHFEMHPLRSSDHDTFRAYLEAVPEANYSIRVRNRGPNRIGVVIAVDGRNIISGSKSNLHPGERMYVLGPYESQVYNGWRTSRNRVNRFYFTDAQDSYSAAFGDYSAMGVIAVAAFNERHTYRSPQRWNKRDQDAHGGSRSKGDAAAPRAEKNGRLADEPGTGYGDDEYSPSRRVSFATERRAFARYFLKYEWRETLCEKGVTDCRRNNRMWDDRWADRGYAPPPPRRARHRSRNRWFSRWTW